MTSSRCIIPLSIETSLPYLEVNGDRFQFDDLLCQDWPQPNVIKTSTTCGPLLSSTSFVYNVTFDTSDSTDKLMIASCFDEATDRTWWSKNYIPRGIELKVNWKGSTSFRSRPLITTQLIEAIYTIWSFISSWWIARFQCCISLHCWSPGPGKCHQPWIHRPTRWVLWIWAPSSGKRFLLSFVAGKW